MIVRTEKELGTALKAEAEEIVVEGESLVKKVLRIKKTGKLAWGLCIGALGVAVGAAMATPAAPILPVVVTAVAGPVVISTLGMSVTTAAITIAVAGGGVIVLNKLRKYRIAEQTQERLVLKRK